MNETCSIPKVSIGMPVYNGEKSIRDALESLITQSFSDFELIVSDNASTDGTERICREYAVRDDRIRYVRQPTNLGPSANFKYVFDRARGKYFMWAACDDIRSPNFLEVNVRVLSENSEYVASTCPNGFDDRRLDQQGLIKFALEGEIYERFIQFFRYCWISHGLFYSLVRADILRSCKLIGPLFLGIDWAIILFLASHGKIHRTAEGYTIFGAKGASNSPDIFKTSRSIPIEFIFPFYRLSMYVYEISGRFTLRQKLRIFYILLRQNLIANEARCRNLYAATVWNWRRILGLDN